VHNGLGAHAPWSGGGVDDIRLARELVQNGLSPVDIRSAVGAGTLRRLRRGAYVDAVVLDADLIRLHRQLISATLKQGHPGAVVSHGSGAVLRDLAVPRSALDCVHLSRDRQGGGQRRAWLQVHGHPLPPEHVDMVGTVPTTSLPRTVIDLACSLPLVDAVAVGDGALRLGATLDDLVQVLAAVGPRRGIGTARRALDLLDPRSESYGESVSRVLLHQHDVVAPLPQVSVFDRRGAFVGRVDLAWPALGVIGEFDGRVKYGRGLAPDEDVAEVLWREKQREDLLRELGWLMVRWTWADLQHPEEWLARLARALERGRSQPAPAVSWTSARSW
jgi:hypothetical protein